MVSSAIQNHAYLKEIEDLSGWCVCAAYRELEPVRTSGRRAPKISGARQHARLPQSHRGSGGTEHPKKTQGTGIVRNWDNGNEGYLGVDQGRTKVNPVVSFSEGCTGTFSGPCGKTRHRGKLELFKNEQSSSDDW